MTQHLKRVAVLLALSLLPIHGSAQSQVNQEIETLLRWVNGEYSNQQQITDGELDAESNLLFPIFRKIDIPAFGDHVIYLQWPIGSPDGRLQRQRIWTFDQSDGAITMNFFTLKEPEQWRDAHLDPDKVRAMTRDDVIAYPATCLLPVMRAGEVFLASIPPTCEIVSQGTRITMTLWSEIIISENRMTYREAGYRPDKSVVFQVPGTSRYEFNKLKD